MADGLLLAYIAQLEERVRDLSADVGVWQIAALESTDNLCEVLDDPEIVPPEVAVRIVAALRRKAGLTEEELAAKLPDYAPPVPPPMVDALALRLACVEAA